MSGPELKDTMGAAASCLDNDNSWISSKVVQVSDLRSNKGHSAIQAMTGARET